MGSNACRKAEYKKDKVDWPPGAEGSLSRPRNGLGLRPWQADAERLRLRNSHEALRRFARLQFLQLTAIGELWQRQIGPYHGNDDEGGQKTQKDDELSALRPRRRAHTTEC